MKSSDDRREHRRLDIRLPLDFHPDGLNHCNVWRTTSINVSTGGVYFETSNEKIKTGDKISLAFEVEPKDPRFPPNGSITTIGEVVRVNPIKDKTLLSDPPYSRFGIGVKFMKPLRLRL